MSRFALHSVMIATVLMGQAASARAGEPPLSSELVAEGLSDPLLVTHAPGDANRIFIIERAGVVKIVKNGRLLPTAFLDLTGEVHLMHERGLLGIAFHPDFARNQHFYVRYNNLLGQHTIARYSVSASNPDVADVSTAHIVWKINNNAAHHNGGSIDFGADGYLYITVGDDANPAHSQNITTQLHGKILRIDVNGDDFPADAQRNYAVPPSNPYVGVAGLDEIWALGLRNPFRASFDRATGDYWISDVGAASWEEINVIASAAPGGANLGWGCMEGAHCGGTACTCFDPSLTMPVHEYSNSLNNCAVIGGRVYRGCAIPQLQGTYFFADYCSNRIWSFRLVNGSVTELQERQSELDPPGALAITSIVGFGEDAFGELYICDMSGKIFKIIPANPPPDSNGNGTPDICEPPLPGDINGDGMVNVDDLLLLLAAWGECAKAQPCPADIAPAGPPMGDGIVNVDDLLVLLANWG